jgi:hypothetical protein
LAKQSQVLAYVNGVVVGYPPHDAIDGSQAAYPTARDSTLGCILTILADNLYDIYMDYKDPTELWDALERKYAVSKDNHLLYICEQLFDFNIDAAKSVVM